MHIYIFWNIHIYGNKKKKKKNFPFQNKKLLDWFMYFKLYSFYIQKEKNMKKRVLLYVDVL